MLLRGWRMLIYCLQYHCQLLRVYTRTSSTASMAQWIARMLDSTLKLIECSWVRGRPAAVAPIPGRVKLPRRRPFFSQKMTSGLN